MPRSSKRNPGRPMKRVQWFQLNIYPTTTKGQFTIALTRNWGYHYHCAKHEKNTCNDCVDFGEKEFIASWYDVESESINVYDVLPTVLDIISRPPDNNYPKSAGVPPISKRR